MPSALAVVTASTHPRRGPSSPARPAWPPDARDAPSVGGDSTRRLAKLRRPRRLVREEVALRVHRDTCLGGAYELEAFSCRRACRGRGRRRLRDHVGSILPVRLDASVSVTAFARARENGWSTD